MVNTQGLQAIGWIFGGTTALVMLVAALLVGEAIASHGINAPFTTLIESR